MAIFDKTDSLLGKKKRESSEYKHLSISPRVILKSTIVIILTQQPQRFFFFLVTPTGKIRKISREYSIHSIYTTL